MAACWKTLPSCHTALSQLLHSSCQCAGPRCTRVQGKSLTSWLARGTVQQLTHFTCCCVSKRSNCLQLSMCPAASVQQLSPCWDVVFSGERKKRQRIQKAKNMKLIKRCMLGFWMKKQVLEKGKSTSIPSDLEVPHR